jgi:S-DNA-T family DNA segregation ATPase FtsK/SpoIIIE
LKKIIQDERFKVVVGILMLFFAIYAFIAFFSFLFTWKVDQSKFDLPLSEYFSSEIDIENWAGKFGALLSKLFIYNLFGISAFAIILISAVWGLKLLKLKTLSLRKTITFSFIGIVWTSIFLSFIFSSETFFLLGGACGYFVSNWLILALGGFGTGVLLLISVLAFVIFTFENSLLWLKNFFRNMIKNREIKSAFTEANKIVKTNNVQIQKQVNQNEKIQNIENEFFEEVFTLPQNGKNKNVIDMDTNQPLVMVDRKKYILSDDGTEKNGLGFEVKNTKTAEEIIHEQSELLDDKLNNKHNLEVEKNQDIETDQEYELGDYDPTLDLSNYQLPSLDLLEDHKSENSEVTNEELISNKNKIVETLANYKIEIVKIKATIGPTITLYEIIPAPGVRISKIKNLEDDIALSLSALGIRIIAPMPGRGTIGIEVPNQKPEIVSMKSVLSSAKFQKSKYELPIALGKTISNESYVFDLTRMPHMLVAGATGQGKSVGLNVILTSILYKKHPSQVKFVLVDPKKVELTLYEKIEKHYLAKLPDSSEAIITDNQKVIHTLNSLNVEMDNRYNLLKAAQVRNIKEYNDKFVARRLNPLKGHQYLPYIVLVIDEFADLIMTAGKEVELPIARIAQLARAVGIHLIVATQRPSTNIITGTIKANFPSRVAFKVASMIDSRTILDSPGANQLIGRGDMLITEGSELVRLQCAFIDTPELDKITSYIQSQQGYPCAFELPEPVFENESGNKDVDLSKRDELFNDAARIVVMNQQGSTSLIQRKLSIGYNRAGRIIDQLEAAGIVGPFEGSKARQVFYSDEYSLEQFLNSIDKNVN